MNNDKKDKESLKTYTRHLEKRLRNLETEKQLLDAERLRLEQEEISLRAEIDRLREPPLIGSVIIKEDPINSGRYIVLTSTGIIAIVNASRKVKDKLEFGTYVALNQRTFAIMDVLTLNEEDIINASKKLASHTIFRDKD